MRGRAACWPIWLAGSGGLLLALVAPAQPVATRAAPALSLDVPATAVTSPHFAAAPNNATQPDTVFRHQDHARVDCLSCHTVDPVHGAVRVRTLSDCRSCHHQPPLSADCARCHTAAHVPEATFALPRAPELSVGVAPPRPLPFRHDEHSAVTCGSCHTEGIALSAAAVDCASCHAQHHAADARCATCHLPVLETPPHPLEVHAGCGGTGCHTELPFEGVPKTRNFCVVCHQQMEVHNPGRSCANCHLLPRPSETRGAQAITGAASPSARRNRRRGRTA